MAPNNPLPIHGNEKTMNLNHLILTNIQSSPYFKVNLYELKTYHEVIDEIYYKVGKALSDLYSDSLGTCRCTLLFYHFHGVLFLFVQKINNF